MERPAEFPQVEMGEAERKRIFPAEESSWAKSWGQGIRAHASHEQPSWAEWVLRWDIVIGQVKVRG